MGKRQLGERPFFPDLLCDGAPAPPPGCAAAVDAPRRARAQRLDRALDVVEARDRAAVGALALDEARDLLQRLQPPTEFIR